MTQSFYCLQMSSDDIETEDAMMGILASAQQDLAKKNYTMPKGAIVFFDIDYDAQIIIDATYAQWPDIQLIGCSSYGEFNTKTGMHDGSIQMMIFGGNIECYVRCFSEYTKDNIAQACQVLADTPSTPAFSVFFSEVIQSFCVEDTLTTLKSLLPQDHIIVGGMAADNYDFVQSIQIANRQILPSGSCMMHFCGDLKVTSSASLGWESYGHRGVVTRSTGCIVYEIDHEPAINFYLKESGTDVSSTAEQPLSVYSDTGDFLYNRTAMGKYTPDHKASEGICFLGNIKEGYSVQLSTSNSVRLLDGIESEIKKIHDDFPNDRKAIFALFFSCASRRVLLSSGISEETHKIQRSLPNDIIGMGFFTFGEVGRMASDRNVEFHNNSLVYALIG